MPRLYEPIWEKLKALPKNEAETKGVAITVPVALHRRVIKAVIKEKGRDLAYKILLQEEDDRVAKLRYTRNGSIITFYLSFTLGLKDFT